LRAISTLASPETPADAIPGEVSRTIHVHDYRTRPDVGSDHYPVIVDISIE